MKTTTNKLLSLTTFVVAAMSFATVDALAEANTWTGGLSGNWSNGGNWSLGEVSETDAVEFPSSRLTATVTVDIDITVASVTVYDGDYITLNYATDATKLTVTGTIIANATGTTIEITGGTTSAGSLDARGGKFIVSGGTVEVTSTGTSSINVQGGQSTFTVSGGNVTTSGGVSVASSGTLTVSSGSLTAGNVTVIEGGTLTASNDGTLTVTGTLDVSGSGVHISGGEVTIGTLKTESNSSFYVEGGTVVVGSLSQANNSGIEVTGGSLEIRDGTAGENTAWIRVSDNGTLILDTAITGTTTGDEGNLTISFADNAVLILNQSLLETIAATEDYYGLLQAETITFGNDSVSTYGSDLNELINPYVQADGYDLEWQYDTTNHMLQVKATATAAPEPSMFGLMFGLGAIGLVATRRRRRA